MDTETTQELSATFKRNKEAQSDCFFELKKYVQELPTYSRNSNKPWPAQVAVRLRLDNSNVFQLWQGTTIVKLLINLKLPKNAQKDIDETRKAGFLNRDRKFKLVEKNYHEISPRKSCIVQKTSQWKPIRVTKRNCGNYSDSWGKPISRRVFLQRKKHDIYSD